MARKKKVENMSAAEQAAEILKIAEKNGVEGNFFFTTTFKRYLVQLNLLNTLEKDIKNDGTLVEKEYVKGRLNVCAHPAVGEYNKTASAANKTVETLMKIIAKFKVGKSEEGEEDELLKFLARGRK